jgi:hypothetical protein
MANLDEFLNPQGDQLPQPDPQQPAQPQPAQPQDAAAEETAKLRIELDQMRMEMSRLRAMAAQPVQPAVPQEDPWQRHIREAMREAAITPNDFVENPMDTFVKASAVTMKKARELWNHDVVSLNSSMRLDGKFEERYPDLYATDNKKKLVGIALTELRGDVNFNRLLGSTETIPQALDLLAKNTYKMLGIQNPHEVQEAPPATIPQRKGTYGTPGGARVSGTAPVAEDTQTSEVGSMVRYMQGNRGPVG